MKKRKFGSKSIFISTLLILFNQGLLSGCIKEKTGEKRRDVRVNLTTATSVIKEKTLAVKEWELVWGDLWNNEAAELRRKGVSNDKIVAQLNSTAAERVAKRLNMDEKEVRRIVDDYYTALNKKKTK